MSSAFDTLCHDCGKYVCGRCYGHEDDVSRAEYLRAVAKARAEAKIEAFEEAAKKFMAVKETEDKLCHHPRTCVVTVAESLLRMAADCRAKAKE